MLLDTQKMVERLESVGVPSPQARMHVVLLSEAVHAVEAAIIERCASKEDMARLEARIEVGAAETKSQIAELKAALAEQKSELIRWVVSVGVLQLALISGLLLKLTG